MRIKAAVPVPLARQLQQIADADNSTISATVRRLLSRAVAREFAQQAIEGSGKESGR
jgi:predicted transcriptional regulator